MSALQYAGPLLKQSLAGPGMVFDDQATNKLLLQELDPSAAKHPTIDHCFPSPKRWLDSPEFSRPTPGLATPATTFQTNPGPRFAAGIQIPVSRRRHSLGFYWRDAPPHFPQETDV